MALGVVAENGKIVRYAPTHSTRVAPESAHTLQLVETREGWSGPGVDKKEGFLNIEPPPPPQPDIHHAQGR